MADFKTITPKSYDPLTVIMADLQRRKYKVHRTFYGSWHILYDNNCSDKLVLNYFDNIISIYHEILMYTKIRRQFDLSDPLSIDKLYITIETIIQLIHCSKHIHDLESYRYHNLEIEQIIENYETRIRLLK